MSDSAARDQEEDKVIMVSDVARAFFEAAARRTICVELPEEETRGRGDVGLLLQSLCGTRDASANFQEEVRKVLTQGGSSKEASTTPALTTKRRVGKKAMVHADDFISSGSRKSLRWFGQVLEGRFEVSTVVVGDGREEKVQETVLNRIIRDHEGWHCEADQRHGELTVKALNLQMAKSVQTPGEDEKMWQEEEDRECLNNQNASQYWALAARTNNLALGRLDIQYAVKEICREMSNPTRGDLRRLRWLGRYLGSFEIQDARGEPAGYTDSEWAVCRKTARSTSGGAILRG